MIRKMILKKKIKIVIKILERTWMKNKSFKLQNKNVIMRNTNIWIWNQKIRMKKFNKQIIIETKEQEI